jgi:hypothetical protein
MKELAQVAYEAWVSSHFAKRESFYVNWESLDPAVQNAWRAIVADVNEFGAVESGSVHARLGRIEVVQNQILEVVNMSVTQAQFDTGLAALQATEAARDAAVTAALNDLAAKVAAGTVATPADFTAELAIITTLQANAAALTQLATTDDPGPTAVPSTPIAAPDVAAADTEKAVS